jgi:hypothetical protein
MRDYTATMIGILTVVVLALVMAFLLGCESPATADHTAPDLGECIGLAASDGGMAHVYAYPNGHPCEGGTCQQGECVP